MSVRHASADDAEQNAAVVVVCEPPSLNRQGSIVSVSERARNRILASETFDMSFSSQSSTEREFHFDARHVQQCLASSDDNQSLANDSTATENLLQACIGLESKSHAIDSNSQQHFAADNDALVSAAQPNNNQTHPTQTSTCCRHFVARKFPVAAQRGWQQWC